MAHVVVGWAKYYQRVGMSVDDAKALMEVAKDAGITPIKNHIGTTHWAPNGVPIDHIQVGPINHIPVTK